MNLKQLHEQIGSLMGLNQKDQKDLEQNFQDPYFEDWTGADVVDRYKCFERARCIAAIDNLKQTYLANRVPDDELDVLDAE